jgi:toxin secretion/phage lysis holin
MALDFITGLIVAAVFKASPKSTGGALASHAAFEGLVKKGMILVFVLIGARLDLILGMTIIRDGVCTAFILSELISITENAGLMGLPIPKAVKRAIELLKDSTENK